MVSLLKKTDPIKSTSYILDTSAAHPLHLRSRDNLEFVSVSQKSKWTDARWIFDNPTPGSSKSSSTFSWKVEFSDGQCLLDSMHSDLLDWLRRLVWSTYASPGGGSRVLKPGTLGAISVNFRYWINWLVDHYITWPSEITDDVVSRYIEDLRALCEGDFVDDQITEDVATGRLMPFVLLWRQRYELLKVGIDPMPQPPFGRAGARAIGREIGATAKGQYKPLPDEVAVSVLNTAMAMLGTPADDVIELIKMCEDAYNSRLTKSSVSAGLSVPAERAQSDIARNWRFSEIDGVPWRQPLEPLKWDEARTQYIEKRLVEYLNEKQASYGGFDQQSSRDPILPVIIHSKCKGQVDDIKLACLLGLEFSEWELLSNHPRLRKLISEVASAQGLPALKNVRIMGRVRRLVLQVRSAAHVVIQATTSMRISEICGLQAGTDPVTGLPTSVKVRDSLSGLAEVFVITSNLSKTEETPRHVEWTLGYRPKGSTFLPPAVRAILVVNRLLGSFRNLSGTKDLFVSLNSRGSIPKTMGGVGNILSLSLLDSARQFIAQCVDFSRLSDSSSRGILDGELVPYIESHGRCIGTHQWRKTFGHFATSVDRGLLPDLQMHFHHVSSAMTDGAYTGNPILERDMNDVRYQKMALLALEIAEGSTNVAGRFGEELETKIKAELSPRIDCVQQEEAYREAFVYVEEAGLDRLFFEPHGICGARSASQMACHKEADTVELARWSNRLKPNYETRTPSLCVGCESFAIAKWHLPFWEERYIEYAAEILHLEIQGLTGAQFENAAALTRARTNQALAICRKLGSDPVDLQARLEHKVEQLNAS